MEIIHTKADVSRQAIFVEKGGYAVNEKYLDITNPDEQNLFVYRYDAGAQFNISRKLQNNVICGLVALTENPNSPGDMMLVPNATLINKGTIDVHFKKIHIEHIRNQTQQSDTYQVDALRGYAMAAGENSVLINEGVINIYMDHDKDAETTIYCCAMWAEANSLLVNKGEIHFYGNGSWQALIRGMGGMANHLQVINEGLITVDVERAFQTRVLHSAGMFGTLWNKGRIKVRVAGRIMTIGSVTGTHMINDGEIDVTSLATLIEGKIPYLFNFPPMATGIYEHFRPSSLLPSPAVNRGSIKVHLIGSEASGPEAIAFGFYYQMEDQDNGETPMRMTANEGIIEVTQEGPVKYVTAEMGVNMQLKTNNPIKLKVGIWRTRNRDFALTHDLFACNSGQFIFSDTRLLLEGVEEGVEEEVAQLNVADLVYKKRYNNNSLNAWSPRLSLNYLIQDKMSLKIGYAHSFVDAPFFYRASIVNLNEGGANLDAEKMDAFQLSFMHEISNLNLTYEINTYYNRLSNLVYYNRDVLEYSNAGKMNIVGVEGVVSHKSERVMVNLTCSYQYVLSAENHSMVTNTRIHHIPNFIMHLMSSYKILSSKRMGDIDIRGNIEFLSKQLAPLRGLSLRKGDQECVDFDNTEKARVIANVGLSYSFKGICIAFDAYNVLNTKYHQGGPFATPNPQQGISFISKISCKF